jgi:Acyl-CoA dehydrogenase, C-terminal domain
MRPCGRTWKPNAKRSSPTDGRSRPEAHATDSEVRDKLALGGNGYINHDPTGRLLRDAKLYEIGAGTSEIRRMLIGRETG